MSVYTDTYAAKAYTIIAWGGLPSEGIDPDSVGKKAPPDSGYTEIYLNVGAEVCCIRNTNLVVA
jgi:hypothetical protein